MPPSTAVSDDCIKQIFREARTHNVWLPQPVSSSCCVRPMNLPPWVRRAPILRPHAIVFLTTLEAKERLRPALSPGNVEKTMAAPVTVIIAWDTKFHEKLPKLFPQKDMRSVFQGNPDLIEATAFRNSSLRRCLLHSRRPRAWPRLRPDVRIRRRQSQRRVFPRGRVEIEFSLQFRLRRRDETLPTQPAPVLR
jgi:hypothetical protein